MKTPHYFSILTAAAFSVFALGGASSSAQMVFRSGAGKSPGGESTTTSGSTGVTVTATLTASSASGTILNTDDEGTPIARNFQVGDPAKDPPGKPVYITGAIKFNPASVSGVAEVRVIQDVNIDCSALLNIYPYNTQLTISSSGSYVLDADYTGNGSTDSEVGLTPDGYVTVSAIDEPGWNFGADLYLDVEINDYYRDFLQYRLKENSPWITVMTLDWTCYGSAPSNPGHAEWQGSINASGGTGVASSAAPILSPGVGDVVSEYEDIEF